METGTPSLRQPGPTQPRQSLQREDAQAGRATGEAAGEPVGARAPHWPQGSRGRPPATSAPGAPRPREISSPALPWGRADHSPTGTRASVRFPAGPGGHESKRTSTLRSLLGSRRAPRTPRAAARCARAGSPGSRAWGGDVFASRGRQSLGAEKPVRFHERRAPASHVPRERGRAVREKIVLGKPCC